MSKWCPKCQRMSQTGDKCDFCGHTMEESSNKDILLNQILQEISDEHQTMQNIDQDKKTRDTLYKEYIAEHYRELGYSVTEHNKEKGSEDDGVDLIAKKDEEVIFISCKDLNENNSHKIDDKDIKILRIDVYDFLEQNPVFKTYNTKMRYTLSENFLDSSAIKYIDTCKDEISYEIVKPTYKKVEQTKPHYSEKLSSKKKVKQNKTLEKIIVVIVAILIILFFIDQSSEKKQIKSSDTHKEISTVTPKEQSVKKDTQEEFKVQKEQEEKSRIKQLLAEQKAEREKQEKEKMDLEKKDQISQEDQIQMVFREKTIEDQKINMKPKEVSKVLNEEDARVEAKRKLLEQMQLKQKKSSNIVEEADPRAEAKRKLLEQMQFSN